MAQITLETIAQKTGLAKSTVSMALRDHPRVAAATRQRVKETAQRLGYRPNAMVSSLMAHIRASRPRTAATPLAFLSSFGRRGEIPHRVTTCSLAGARRRAQELGFQVEVFHLDEFGTRLDWLGSILRNRGVRGLLIGPGAQLPFRLSLDWEPFTGVAIGQTLLEPRLHVVTCHQYQVIMLALERLYEAGFRRIGVVLREETDQRTQGLFAAGYASFLEREEDLVRLPRLKWTEQPEDLRRWCTENRPEAIITDGADVDPIIADMEEATRPAFVHLDVPGDGHRFSGVNQNWDLVGAVAAEVLVASLQRNETGIPPTRQTVLIDGCWNEGATLGRMERVPMPAG